MIDLAQYPLVSGRGLPGAQGRPRTVVEVAGIPIGAGQPVIVAGPCAVEGREQLLRSARAARRAGAQLLRGGAYKPRTSPYSFQGLGREGLEYLAEARAETGLPIVTEVMDPRLVEVVAEVADVFQVGARSMQNFPLLVELGQQRKPVLLKRAFWATLEEWLGAAEYIARAGNTAIILCERGIRTFAADEYSRNTVDLNVVPALLQATHLPVLVDPSHATGRAEMVPAVARAALAAGAHGLLVELRCADTPAEALLSDGQQAILEEELAAIVSYSRSTTRQSAGGQNAAGPAPEAREVCEP